MLIISSNGQYTSCVSDSVMPSSSHVHGGTGCGTIAGDQHGKQLFGHHLGVHRCSLRMSRSCCPSTDEVFIFGDHGRATRSTDHLAPTVIERTSVSAAVGPTTGRFRELPDTATHGQVRWRFGTLPENPCTLVFSVFSDLRGRMRPQRHQNVNHTRPGQPRPQRSMTSTVPSSLMSADPLPPQLTARRADPRPRQTRLR